MLTAHSHDIPRRAADIRPLAPADLSQLSAFLCRSFGALPDAQFGAPAMLFWKYLATAGRGTTSWVVERDGNIVAHAGVLRARMQAPAGASLECATVIDWAADIAAPGAGLALYRHAMRQAEATYLLGGTPATRALADRLGFRRATDAFVFTRWVRPVREFLRRPRTARAWLRLAHGIAGAAFRRLSPERGMSVARVPQFDEAVEPVLEFCATPHALASLDVAALNHRLACPVRRMRGHVLVRGGAVVGVAVSSLGDWDAKILQLRLNSADLRDWCAAYGLVTGALAAEARVCRVSAMTTVPLVAHALAANHFWRGRAEPVLLHDPTSRSNRFPPIDFSYFDTDFDHYSA